MTPDKRLTRTEAVHAATGLAMQGYEIHIGRSDGPDRARPFAHVAGAPEGAVSADGRVMGSYLHGMFGNDAFRAAFLRPDRRAASGLSYAAGVEATLDALAAHLEAHLDVDGAAAPCAVGTGAAQRARTIRFRCSPASRPRCNSGVSSMNSGWPMQR